MDLEHVSVKISAALDLLQLIAEDVEANFIKSGASIAIKGRASMTVSALHIVSDYLRAVVNEA